MKAGDWTFICWRVSQVWVDPAINYVFTNQLTWCSHPQHAHDVSCTTTYFLCPFRVFMKKLNSISNRKKRPKISKEFQQNANQNKIYVSVTFNINLKWKQNHMSSSSLYVVLVFSSPNNSSQEEEDKRKIKVKKHKNWWWR